MNPLGPEARSILNAGRDGDDPTNVDRTRVRKNLARAIAAGGALGAAGAAAAEGSAAAAGAAAASSAAVGAASAGAAVATGKALSFALVGKVLGGLFVAGAIVAGVTLSRSPSTAPPAASVATSLSAVAEAAPTPAASALATIANAPSNVVAASASAVADAASAAPVTGTSAAALPGPSAAAAPKPDAELAPASATATVAGEDPLEAETRRLREAHGALQSGDPGNALKLLDEQSAAYADGQLREERAAARVLALCKLGKVDEARAAAAAFLRDNPLSPLTGRVSGGCPAAPTP